jgi:hypothetical protein
VSYLKDQGLTSDLDTKLLVLRIVRGARTVGVAVKCVDINWNTKGEGRHLGFS